VATTNSKYPPSKRWLPLAAPGLLLLALLSPGQTEGRPPSAPRDYADVVWYPVTVTFQPTRNDPPSPPLPTAAPVVRPRPTVGPAPSYKARPTATPRTYQPTVADAKAYALAVLGPTQFACLDQIAIHESHWNPFDLNRSSGAYGIPQAVPGSKMAWAGADWRTNPVTQVKWMIHYVDGRYGSACQAWAFWQTHRWY
jgi:hypothetical protein